MEVRTPGSRYRGIRTLAVARLDRLGDVVLTLPALAALRAAYPAARLAVLVRESTAPLVRMVEGVDDVVGVEAGVRPLTRALREIAPDLLVSISRGPAAAWAGIRAGVPYRVGTGYRLFSFLFERRVDEHRRAGSRHEVEYALSFAHRAGAAGEPERFGIVIPDAVQHTLADWLRVRGLAPRGHVVLHPGSGGSCPSWPASSWAQLTRLLCDAGTSVVVSFGPGDAATAAAFDRAAPDLCELPRFGGGIVELAALAAGAGAFASNNTGPLHLAAAVGAPTLGLYPSWATCGVERWGPYAANGWALVVESPEASTGGSQLAAVPPETVARSLSALIRPV
jgi:heptosyltransferase-2